MLSLDHMAELGLQITGGPDGCTMRLDGLVLRAELNGLETMAAYGAAKRAAHDALGMLAATLAKSTRKDA